MKKINLLDLCSLCNDMNLSERYIRYKLEFEESKQYRHSEICDIKNFLSFLSITEKDVNDFIYSYSIPQLNKEFDLIKICPNYVINIEIKGSTVSLEKKLKQIKANRHYLKLLNRKIYSFSFDSSNNQLLIFENDSLIKFDVKEIVELLEESFVCDDVDLDEVFSPKNILVSPLNDTKRFIDGNYLLTENQENIKNKILSLYGQDETIHIGICGNAGTGKTLLLYDIAKDLSIKHNVTIIHCGKMCVGHSLLNEALSNFKIIDAKSLRYKEFLNSDVILVDESHRIYNSYLQKIIKWSEKSKTLCIFSYDEKQILSKAEKNRNVVKDIIEKCKDNCFKLTNKIRTNKEINVFIQALFDLGRIDVTIKYPNVNIVYASSNKDAIEKVRCLEQKEYKYISYTSSFYNGKIDWQKTDDNTHTVIGQEFENVVMIMGNSFYYDGNILKAVEHPNPDYLFDKLLYQGLTRTRKKLTLIITDKDLLDNILKIVNNR